MDGHRHARVLPGSSMGSPGPPWKHYDPPWRYCGISTEFHGTVNDCIGCKTVRYKQIEKMKHLARSVTDVDHHSLLNAPSLVRRRILLPGDVYSRRAVLEATATSHQDAYNERSRRQGRLRPSQRGGARTRFGQAGEGKMRTHAKKDVPGYWWFCWTTRYLKSTSAHCCANRV